MAKKNIQVWISKDEIWTLKDFIKWYYTDHIGKKKYTPKDNDRVIQAVSSIQDEMVITIDKLIEHVDKKLNGIQSKQTKRPLK